VAALSTDDDPDTEALLETLVVSDPSRRWGAFEALHQRSGDVATRALERIAGEGRLDVAAALYRLTGDGNSRATLEAALGAEDWSTRLEAAEVLSESGDSCGVGVLVEALADASPRDRLRAAEVLLANGDIESAFHTFADLATDDYPLDVRLDVVETLGRADSDDAIDALVDLVEIENEDVALASARTLLHQGIDVGIGRLVRHAVHLPREELEAFVLELDDTRPGGLFDVLEPLLRRGAPEERRIAGHLLPMADDVRAVALAIELLDDEDVVLRIGAAHVLVYDDGADSEHALAKRVDALLADATPIPDGTGYEPLFESVADAVFYALERRDRLLALALRMA
jgi:HEAT repeat protein